MHAPAHAVVKHLDTLALWTKSRDARNTWHTDHLHSTADVPLQHTTRTFQVKVNMIFKYVIAIEELPYSVD